MGASEQRRPKQLVLLDAKGEVPRKARRRKRRRGVKLGRPAKAERFGFVAHATRETHDARHPVHVSMRRVKLAPSFRSERIYRTIVEQLARAKKKQVHVVHLSVQHDHLHLIVEGADRHALSKQMRILFSRIAMFVNAVCGRRGSLFRDRHHRRELTTPTQTRNALVYVLFNERKHDAQNGGSISERMLMELDEHSSVGWVEHEHWAEAARPPPELLARLRARNLDAVGEAPVSAPTTWLARTGWHLRGGGRMRLHEQPRFA